MTDHDTDSEHGPRVEGRRWIPVPPWFVAAAGVVLIAILASVLVLVFRDDGETIATVDSTTSTVAESTSSQAETTATSEATTSTIDEATTTSASSTTSESTTTSVGPSTSTVPTEFQMAVWPWFSSEIRYDEPVEAARGFAEDFLGFTDPVVGELLEGDSRSGEVEVKPSDDGPVTTVLVRLLGTDDTWWVLGSVTENISVSAPLALCEIESPLSVSGEALTFEGNVDVEIRADGIEDPLGSGTVIGGGSEMPSFEGVVPFATPRSASGAVVFSSRGGSDGTVWDAVVLRVFFGPGGC